MPKLADTHFLERRRVAIQLVKRGIIDPAEALCHVVWPGIDTPTLTKLANHAHNGKTPQRKG